MKFTNESPAMRIYQEMVAQWTILKLPGAKYIDLEVDGKRKVIAKALVILIRKNRKNPRYKFLRPTVYVRGA
ncbi:MAG: hypothetical protein AB1847_04030 [bacterium]